MPAPQARPYAPGPSEPVVHELPPIRFEGAMISVRLAVRRAEDGTWRARLIFFEASGSTERATAEIFCATSEQDLWQAVRDIRDHHLRDLYRSLGA